MPKHLRIRIQCREALTVIDIPVQISTQSAQCNLRSVMGLEMGRLVTPMIRFAKWTVEIRNAYSTFELYKTSRW